MRSYTAGANEDGMRLSRFVLRVTQGLPESQMHRHFRNKRIKVNGHRQPPEYRLAAGDLVQLYLNDEFFPAPEAGHTPHPAGAAPLPSFGTVYEDTAVAILYKPAGVLSHPGSGGGPTLLDAFTHSLIARGEYDPHAEHTFAPALCNRLDRNTEGLVVAAKTAPALREMNNLIRDGLLQKTYLCVCTARPPQGILHAWLLRDRRTHSVRISDAALEGSKPIITEASLRDSKNGLYLCQVRLHTGRTHQIRAHLAHLGAPLLGDAKYGGTRHPAAHTGQALCAWQLAFPADIPQSSPLAPLAGRSFTADDAQLPQWWAKLQA